SRKAWLVALSARLSTWSVAFSRSNCSSDFRPVRTDVICFCSPEPPLKNGAENQQRDDVCATHHRFGSQISKTVSPARTEFRNLLPPLAICRGDLTQKFKFIEAFA